MLVISESTLALVNDGLWLCRPVSFTPGTTPDMLVVYKNGVDGYGDPNYYVVGTMTGSAFDPLTLQMQATIQCRSIAANVSSN